MCGKFASKARSSIQNEPLLSKVALSAEHRADCRQGHLCSGTDLRREWISPRFGVPCQLSNGQE